MFSFKVNRETELKLIEVPQARLLFNLIDANRSYLRVWHPYFDLVRTPSDVERFITKWLAQFAGNRGFHAGIWHNGTLCGAINHLNIDWANKSTVLSYWLDENHQGLGIMTASCQAMVTHALDTLNLNRVTIECATENVRSRRIPERLGFTLEGIVRGTEWLHDHFADHAIYGLLKTDPARVEVKLTTPISFLSTHPEASLVVA